MVRFSKWLIVCALVLSIGGHWAVLQSVAWVTMTVNFSQRCSLGEALNKTFDGKHPCKLCQAVREGKKSEAKQEAKMEIKKVDLLTTTTFVYQFPKTVQLKGVYIPLNLTRYDRPAFPPPRNFLG